MESSAGKVESAEESSSSRPSSEPSLPVPGSPPWFGQLPEEDTSQTLASPVRKEHGVELSKLQVLRSFLLVITQLDPARHCSSVQCSAVFCVSSSIRIFWRMDGKQVVREEGLGAFDRCKWR